MSVVEQISHSKNGHHNTANTRFLDRDEDRVLKVRTDDAPSFNTLGFRFVRYFLLVILCVVSSMVGLIGFLGWHLGMDVTVEGHGQVEPVTRYEVKVQRSGLIHSVCVQHGQVISQGDLVVTLDDTDLRSEVAQVERELAMNESRRVALGEELQRERAILETEITRAEFAHRAAFIQLEQVRREYQIYHKYVPFRLDGRARPSVDTLMPIRLQQTRLQQAEVEVERAKRRLAVLDNRKQEQITFKQMAEKLEADQRLLKTHLAHMKVYAPVSGTVLTRDLDKRVGDYVQAGEAVVELAELNGWQARVMIQEVDIPKVKAGQGVRLYVAAFPHMEYRVFDGEVVSVSSKPASTMPAGADLVIGGIAGAVYPVVVRIQDPEIFDGEQVYSLAYGMGVDAKIVTDRGRVVDLLWKKFLKTVGKIGRPEIYRLEDRAEDVQAVK